MDHAVRVGLVSYGVVHLVLAWLALQLAFGTAAAAPRARARCRSSPRTPSAGSPCTSSAVGFVALVVWQAHGGDLGAPRRGRRQAGPQAGDLRRQGGALRQPRAVARSRPRSGRRRGGGGTEGLTAKLMKLPGRTAARRRGRRRRARGRGLPGLPRLDGEVPLQARASDGKTGKDGSAYVLFGKVGYIAKGVALADRRRCCSSTPRSPTTRRSPAASTRRCTRCSSSRSAPRCSWSSRSASRATGCSASPGPATSTAERALRDRPAPRVMHAHGAMVGVRATHALPGAARRPARGRRCSTRSWSRGAPGERRSRCSGCWCSGLHRARAAGHARSSTWVAGAGRRCRRRCCCSCRCSRASPALFAWSAGFEMVVYFYAASACWPTCSTTSR